MLLFSICINPLPINLDRRLQGIKIRPNINKTTTIAYADDVAIIIRHHGETDDIRQILDVTGANINENKSHALVLGAWSQTVSVMNIKYEDIKILRFKMSSNTKVSAKASWETLIAKIRAQAAENYHRALNLESRIR